ncbi:MAG: molybdopterin-dependent oxidoreductase [Anaerolineae bacterium]
MRLFTQQIHGIPSINPRHWAFALTGRVQHPLILSFEDVQASPTLEISAAIVCAHQPSDDQPDDALVYDAIWGGVPLSSLFEEVDIDPAVTGATLYAADGYTCTLTLEQLRSAVLVTTMNGDPLPVEHGYPARIVVPGQYGFKSPKWIERIHFSDASAAGTWESRGWITDAIQPFASIDVPRMKAVIALGEPAVFRGVVASAQSQSLQVRVNRILLEAVQQPTPAGSLIEWSATWTPTIPGDYVLRLNIGESPSRTVRVR